MSNLFLRGTFVRAACVNTGIAEGPPRTDAGTADYAPSEGAPFRISQNLYTNPTCAPRILWPLTSAASVKVLVRPAEPDGRKPALGSLLNESARAYKVVSLKMSQKLPMAQPFAFLPVPELSLIRPYRPPIRTLGFT